MNPSWTPEQVALYSILDLAVQDIVEFSSKKIPALGNKGTPEIIDMAGRQNELRKGAEKVENLLKNLVTVKLDGKKEGRGDRYQITIVETSTNRLDQTRAKEVLEKLSAFMTTLRVYVEDGDRDGMCLVATSMVKTLTGDLKCMSSTEGERRTFNKLAPPAQ